MAAVSVIVPVYNVERHLGSCLESLRRQTHRDLEVIMVDDGSTDGSAEIAGRFCDDDARFRLVRQANHGPGPGGGRNGGLASATGEFVMFVDGDDIVPASAVESLVEPMTGRPQCVVSTGNVRRLEGVRVRPSRLHDRCHQQSAITTMLECPALVFDPAASNKLFGRTHFDETIGRFPERILYEDMVASMAAYIEAPEVAVVPEPVYLWRIRQDGSSITQDHLRWRNQLDRFTQLRRLAELLRAPAMAETKRWLDWKVVSLDLAYTESLLVHLADDSAVELLAETNRLLDELDIDPGISLNPAVRARLTGLRTRDLDACRHAFGAGPIRPDRRPAALDREPDLVIRPSLIAVVARDGEMIIDVKVSRGLESPALVASSPAPLAGGQPIWRVPMTSKAPGWLRARLSNDMVTATLGEIHLQVVGTVDGHSAAGEVERSHWHRAGSVVTREAMVVQGPRLTSTFFEDAQLHLWCGEPDPAIDDLRIEHDVIELTVRSDSGRLPAVLTLAAVDREHTVDATPTGCDGATATFRIQAGALHSGAAYAIARRDDAADPEPIPIELSPTAAHGPAMTRSHRLEVGERGQAVLRPPTAASIRAVATEVRRRLNSAARGRTALRRLTSRFGQ